MCVCTRLCIFCVFTGYHGGKSKSTISKGIMSTIGMVKTLMETGAVHFRGSRGGVSAAVANSGRSPHPRLWTRNWHRMCVEGTCALWRHDLRTSGGGEQERTHQVRHCSPAKRRKSAFNNNQTTGGRVPHVGRFPEGRVPRRRRVVLTVRLLCVV